MTCFQILGIEETIDLRKIKKAYASLLPKFSPESDEEGFKKLRQAYEEANEYAQNGGVIEEAQSELSETDKFMQEFKALYEDYGSRIKTDTWKTLLDRDICFTIDTLGEINSHVLDFLMEHYFLPNEVWQLFDKTFNWASNKIELEQQYPPAFIQYIISQLNEESKIYFEELIDAKDGKQEEFLKVFWKLNLKIKECNYYEVEEDIRVLKEICETHPDIFMVEANYLFSIGRIFEAIDKISKAIEKKQDDYDYYAYRAEFYIVQGELEKAYEDCKKAVELKPDNYGIMLSALRNAIALELYEEAESYADILSENVAYSTAINIYVHSAYEFRCAEVEKLLQENSQNVELKSTLAKLYLYTNRNQEAYKIFHELEVEKQINEKAALTHIRLLSQMQLPLELLEKVDYYIEQFPKNEMFYFMKGYVLSDLKRHEEALQCYDQALNINSDNCSVLSGKSYELIQVGKYKEAIAVANKSIELSFEPANAYKNKAYALFELEMYVESLEMCNKSIAIFPLEKAFEIKMEIYFLYSQEDDVLAVFEEAEMYNMLNDKMYKMKGDVAYNMKNYEMALECYNKAIELNQEEELYHIYKADTLNVLEDYGNAILEYEKAIAINPDSSRSYFYRCVSYYKKNDIQTAIKEATKYINTKTELIERFYKFRGDMYKELGEKYIHKILQDYEKALEICPTEPEYLYDLGFIYQYLERWQEAISLFKRNVEVEPDNPLPYIRITSCFFENGEFGECISWADKGLSIDEQSVILYGNKAESLFNLGKYEQALEVCRIGLSHNKDDQDLIYIKSRIYHEQQRYEEAVALMVHLYEIAPDSDVAKQSKEFYNKLLKLVNH